MSSSWSATPPSPEYLAESRVASFLAASIALPVIATVFVLARVYTRAVILVQWSIDDTLIMIAWLCSLGVMGLDIGLKGNGTGRHIETNTMAANITLLKLSYAVRIVYQMTLTFTKLSICFFYLRILSIGYGRYVFYALIGYIVATTICTIAMMIFQCSPIHDNWSIPPGNCPVSNLALNVTIGVLNIVGDVALLIGVLPRIARLQLPPKQKAGVLAIVATYLLVIIAAIVRVSLVSKADNNIDQTWAYVEIGIWSVLEINTGLFCVSVIAIRPLLRQICPTILKSYWSSVTSRSSRGSKVGREKTPRLHQQAEQKRAHQHDLEEGGSYTSNGSYADQYASNVPLANREREREWREWKELPGESEHCEELEGGR